MSILLQTFSGPGGFLLQSSLLAAAAKGPSLLNCCCCQGTKPPCCPTFQPRRPLLPLQRLSGCNRDSVQAGDPQPKAPQYADSERCVGSPKGKLIDVTTLGHAYGAYGTHRFLNCHEQKKVLGAQPAPFHIVVRKAPRCLLRNR